MKKANIGVKQYRPEMGDKKPIAEIEAKYSSLMGKYRLSTPLKLSGRGIKYHDTYTEQNCTNPSKYGWNVYYVTKNAFEKLSKEYSIAQELLLD
ncbi:hypothetical protein [Bacillus smithii]|uniref:hypothetical protein n=1 Tax=Bacillus smithii TaxID=1479 RepID=UPI003D24177B